MPFYHRLGILPPKRHTQFPKPDGSLYREELMGTRGFSGIQSILYHHQDTTRLKDSQPLTTDPLNLLTDLPLAHHHIDTENFSSSGDGVTSRVWLLGNSSVRIGLATPTENMNYFYRNGMSDELLFVHRGSGKLYTQFGVLPFRKGDYIVLPVGTTWQVECDAGTRFLVVEASGQIVPPRRYLNECGQFLEHSPYCERDIVIPAELITHNEKRDYQIHVKMGEKLSVMTIDHHPFDVVGWDGFLYPWIFNIENFEPLTGRIHQPPPIHQTFSCDGFVVCSFVPRLFDYHPLSIPAPYNHSNVNSDEVIYYAEGEYMARPTIRPGTFTHHPAGMPHGPQPGAVEKSIGAKETKEYSVMIDTFAPLYLTQHGYSYCNQDYLRSWLD